MRAPLNSATFFKSFILVVTEVLQNCRARGVNKLIFMKRMYGGKCIMIHLWPVYKGGHTCAAKPSSWRQINQRGVGGGGEYQEEQRCRGVASHTMKIVFILHASRKKNLRTQSIETDTERQKMNCETHQYTCT